MNKFLTATIVIFLYSNCAPAQTNFDRNKVLNLFQDQQFEEAINYLSPIAANDTKNILLLGYMGYAHYMNDNEAAAKKYYQAIFDLDSNNIGAISYLAILNKTDHPDTALQFTRRLIDLQPGKAAHYRNIAELFKRTEQNDSALLNCGRAYQLAPKDNRNGIGLADILVENKIFSKADSIIAAGLLLDSMNSALLKLNIRSAYNSGNYQAAVIPGERLLRMNAPATTAFTQLGLSYYSLKLYNDCIRIFDYLDDNGYANEKTLYYTAKAWMQLKEYNKSNELLKTCVTMAISKDAEQYYYSLGQNYESLKLYKKAVENYDTAYYLFKNPIIKYHCGRISEVNLKNDLLAKKYYREYLAKARPLDAEEKKLYEYVKSKIGYTVPVKRK